MLKKRNLIWLISLIIITVILGIPSAIWMKKEVKSDRAAHRSALDPVIMVPGSSATQNRFDSLVKIINQGSARPHSLIKVTVERNNKLRISGKLLNHDHRPFMVIAFADNADGYQPVQHQAAWMNIAVNQLEKIYGFNRFSGIGHSNGGLIWTLYLEKYFNQNQFSIDRLMTIGTPYNFKERNPKKQTNILKELINGRKKLPKHLTVYSINGSINYTTDGLVSAESVATGKYIFQGQVAHYTRITVTGNNTEHSDLPQNQQIIKLIKQNILENQNPQVERK